MNHLKYLLMASATLAITASPVLGQSETNDWEGAYIGGSIGLAAQKK
jgi:hypothetical protein